ncbi:MAG: hypothetical protein L3J71_02505 [Victivallaceae bacterium]|nr:hypothetical protein [Victivallaceae bacterium]
MNTPIAFNFKNNEIRTYVNELQEIEFNGLDVAQALGYKNPADALARHCKAKGVVKRYTLTNGGNQKSNYITESNVYRMVAHSKMPAAEKFEEWIYDTVLPTIRKTGSYRQNSSDIIVKGIEEHTEYASGVNYPIIKGNLKTIMTAHRLDKAALIEIIKSDKPGVLYKKCVFGQILSTIIGRRLDRS